MYLSTNIKIILSCFLKVILENKYIYIDTFTLGPCLESIKIISALAQGVKMFDCVYSEGNFM